MYAGGKSRVADLVWSALGNVRNYVEPFFGSGAVLLARPHAPQIETVNDADGHLANVWRALQAAPHEVARHADHPVNELDLHAWHRELVARAREVKASLEADPRAFDAELAGRWIWGASMWIGSGWCAPLDRPPRQRPQLMGNPRGVHAKRLSVSGTNAGRGVQRQLPKVDGAGGKRVHGHGVGRLGPWFEALSARLRSVRVCCGDFERVLGPAVVRTAIPGAITGLFLDPPYRHDLRDATLYAHEDATASDRARAWCLAHGEDPTLRIVLAGLDGEHAELDGHGWRVVSWTGASGYARVSGNRHRERLWLSPHCLSGDGPLFDG